MRLELALIRPRHGLDGVRRSSEPSHVAAIKAGGYELRESVRGSLDHCKKKGVASRSWSSFLASLGEALAVHEELNVMKGSVA
jgi:hypothetical protein